MSNQNPSDPTKKLVPQLPVSRRDFVRKIVGGTGAALPGFTVLGNILPAETVLAAGGTVEVPASADATLMVSDPNTPHGSDTTLDVAVDGSGNYINDVLVQFQKTQVQSAILAQTGPYNVFLVVSVESLSVPAEIGRAHV